jgi:hypothetical protein
MVAEGASVRLDSDTVGRVLDAARRQDADPKVLIEEAVRATLGDRENREAKVEVKGFRHSGDNNRVTLGMPSTRVVRRAARGRDQTVNELVRGAVSQVADSVRARDERERQSAQSTGTGPVLPLADPLGLIEAATNGMFADPLAQMLRGQASPGRARRGGGRVR